MYNESKSRIYDRLNTKPQTSHTIHKKSLGAVLSDYFSHGSDKQRLLRTLPCFLFAIAIAFSLAAVSTYTKHHSYYPQEDTYVISSKFAAKNESIDAGSRDGSFDVSLVLDDATVTVSCAPITVADFLSSLNVDMTGREPDLPSDMLLTESAVIHLNMVDYVTTTELETIPYGAVSEYTQDIPAGEVRVISEGINGSRTTTYTQKYINGQKSGEPQASVIEEIAPVDAHLLKGEMGSFVGKDGVTYHYKDIIDVSATAYVAPYGAYTYSGEQVSMEVIAVDQRVIPLGTEVYVECDYFDPGYRRALDIGGLIIGKRIDVFMGYDRQAYNEAIQWGVRDAKVYILVD